MGSVELECPLCCNETFNSHEALKYHLLSIVDNLLCAQCGTRFEKILELAEHIGNKCKDPQPTFTKPEETEYVDIEEALTGSILHKSALSKELQSNNTELIVLEEENENEEVKAEDMNQDEMFYCSSCMISFTSVEEHLEAYHEGQTVFVENGKSDPEKPQEEADYVVVEGNEDLSNINEDSMDASDLTNEQIELNTLKQEECQDKEGRRYTRKVVQIEKFWADSKEDEKPPPNELQYILENGKAKKATNFDSTNLSESQKVLVIYECPLCAMHFSKLDQYQKHSCNKSSTTVYKCTKCNLTFPTPKSANAHMKLHKHEKGNADHTGPFVCETCNTEFPSFKSLRLHKRMHDPIKSKEVEPPVSYDIMGFEVEQQKDDPNLREMFICSICNNSYDKQYEEVHMQSHLDGKKFDCEVCNRKFYSQTNLDMHMRVHQSGKKFSCSHCKKNFILYEALQEHVKNQCQNHMKSYECQFCGRRFVRPHEKVKHERIHTGEKPHVCSICGKAFRVSYCLTLHMRTHSGTRPYQCKICNKRFKAHSVYNHHLLTHSNVRNYKCPYCPKSFKTGVQLAGHKNSHIKPFTCTECNRPFASLYAVRAHMESHYRENNLKYNCSQCGASYARAFALRDHIRAHHPGTSDEKADLSVNETIQDFEMTEVINASNTILPVDEDGNVLVQLENGTVEKVELVEQIVEEQEVM